VQQDATQEQDGTSILRQLKPKISDNADHKLDDARSIKETNELALQVKRVMNFIYSSTDPIIYLVGPLGH
jgi:hypothetical protein